MTMKIVTKQQVRPAKARAERVFMPTEEVGACIVCAKEGLGHGSWCYGCGSFCCTTHDTAACLSMVEPHCPDAHLSSWRVYS